MKVCFTMNQANFADIPGNPIAYWISPNMSKIFRHKSIKDYADVKTGMSTGDNDKYLRFWHEVMMDRVEFKADEMSAVNLIQTPWLPYNKGGDARKWYGNNEYVVKWAEHTSFHRPRLTYSELFLKEGLTWSFVTSGMFSARYYRTGCLWDVAGSPCVANRKENLKYLVALLSTKIASEVLKLINPTLNCQVVDIQRVPVIIEENKREEITTIANNSINLSIKDWDSFEASWDFKKHPLI